MYLPIQAEHADIIMYIFPLICYTNSISDFSNKVGRFKEKELIDLFLKQSRKFSIFRYSKCCNINWGFCISVIFEIISCRKKFLFYSGLIEKNRGAF